GRNAERRGSEGGGEENRPRKAEDCRCSAEAGTAQIGQTVPWRVLKRLKDLSFRANRAFRAPDGLTERGIYFGQNQRNSRFLGRPFFFLFCLSLLSITVLVCTARVHTQ